MSEYNRKKIVTRTVVSSLVLLVFIGLCAAFIAWIFDQPKEEGAYRILRKSLSANEWIFSKLFNPRDLAKNYSKSDAAGKVRVNGYIGLRSAIDAENWKLRVIRNDGDTLWITLDEIRALPKTDVIFDFKCIEGWSQVTYWAGVKFSDFVKAYHLEDEAKLKYCGLNTPDKKYYVGIDNQSMLHPQTILCYEMNEEALPMNQGAPLRLIIPVKYGVKHLKRIGTIFFSEERPPDYWYERGYDYYCGL